MKKRWTALFLVLCLLLGGQAMAQSLRVTGEAIELPGEELRTAHEDEVLRFMQSLAYYTMDDITQTVVLKNIQKDSAAYQEIRHFDCGWFPEHDRVKTGNGRTENYSGDGKTGFACDAYLTVAARLRGEQMYYDMAYHITWECADGRNWRVTRFTNIETKPDRVSLDALNSQDDGIHVEAVTGSTWKGFLMTVDDPSRVRVGVASYPFSDTALGWTLDKFAEKYGASAVVNGGGFSDPNGMGKGGNASGIVVAQGKLLQKHAGGTAFGTIIGFDSHDRLIVREGLSQSQANELDLRDAVGFHPALIIDGEIRNNSGTNALVGLTARTAIGQTEDGKVLFLIADGRQPDSLGASVNEMAKVLYARGAINAANLDGGTSTALVVHGVKVNDGTTPLRISRTMPTAFIVR